jgi:hypothetical protein
VICVEHEYVRPDEKPVEEKPDEALKTRGTEAGIAHVLSCVASLHPAALSCLPSCTFAYNASAFAVAF